MNYNLYLKSDHWREVKNRYYGKLNNKVCFICDSPKNLNLHHKTYKNIGDEKNSDLVCLCRKHHKECHDLIKISLLFGFHTNLKTIVRKLKKSEQKKTDLRNSWYKAIERVFNNSNRWGTQMDTTNPD